MCERHCGVSNEEPGHVFCLSYSDVCFDAVEGDIDGISCCKCVSFSYTNTLQLDTNW